jgi:hypothetical protein
MLDFINKFSKLAGDAKMEISKEGLKEIEKLKSSGMSEEEISKTIMSKMNDGSGFEKHFLNKSGQELWKKLNEYRKKEPKIKVTEKNRKKILKSLIENNDDTKECFYTWDDLFNTLKQLNLKPFDLVQNDNRENFNYDNAKITYNIAVTYYLDKTKHRNSIDLVKELYSKVDIYDCDGDCPEDEQEPSERCSLCKEFCEEDIGYNGNKHALYLDMNKEELFFANEANESDTTTTLRAEQHPEFIFLGKFHAANIEWTF